MRRPKYLVLGLIALMMGVVIYRDRILLDPPQWIWQHYQHFKWWLLPHGVAGALALFLGPLQFSKTLRQRHLRWHRLMGRVYVCGVAAAAPLGIVIESIKYVYGIAPLRLLIGSAGFAFLWAVSTGVGFSLARRAQIQQHQKWMTRSYAIATVFLQTRCVDQLPWLSRLLQPAMEFLEKHFVSTLWMHMAFSIIAAELILRYERSRQLRSRSTGAAYPKTGTATA
jgi:uncharacterized membrane protein